MTGKPLVFVCAAVTWLLPMASTAQTTIPKSAIPTFHFDLRNRTSDDLLPFDIRFNVRAKVDDVVSGGTLQNLTGDCPRDADALRKSIDSADPKKKFESTAVGAGENRELLFSVSPPLLPNRDYCFVFTLTRALTQSEEGAFQSAVTKTIDQYAANIKVAHFTPDQLVELRNRMAADIATATAKSGAKPQPSKESVFNVDQADASTMQAKFNTQLGDILQQQLNRQSAAKGFCRERKQAKTLIDAAFTAGSAVPKLLKAIKADDSDPNVHKAIGTRNESLDRLIKSDFVSLLTDDRCKEDGEGIPAIDAMRDQEDIRAIREQLTGLRDDFANVEKILDDTAGDQKTLKALKSDSKKVLGAKEALKQSREQLDIPVSRLDKFSKALSDRVTAVTTMASSARAEVRTTVPLVSSSTADFTTRHGFYVTMDIGLATAPWDVKQTFTYAGMNIYTRPINKQAPLQLHDPEWLRKRLSFTLGLTLQNVQQQNAFGGIIGDRAVVTGVGFRVLDSVKLTGGALWIKESNPNPLVNRTRIAATPFLALSIDWDVRGTFASLGSALSVPQ